VAHWKEGGSARGAHLRGRLAMAATPDSSLLVADFTDEVDTRQCRFAVGVATWFTLAGAAWSRRRRRGSPDSFPVKAERDEEGKIRPVWARHVERKKMGGPAMHTLEHWVGGGADNGAFLMVVGGGRDRGGVSGSVMGRRKKSGAWAAPAGRLMGRLLWVGPK
jgi:hypothetical protein